MTTWQSPTSTALRFYYEMLGFELMQHMGRSAAFISVGGYHHHIALDTWGSYGGSPPPPWSTASRRTSPHPTK